MSFFPGKSKDGTKEFEDMRRALSSEKAAEAAQAAPAGNDSAEASPHTPPAIIGQPASRPISSGQLASEGPTLPDQCASVIFADTTCEGTFKTSSSVRIEGQLSGEVEAGNTIHVAEGARVNAKMRASFIVIAGTVEGQIECDELLELKPTSHISGEITTKSVSIHEGAFFEGQMHMVRNNTAESRHEGPSLESAPSRGTKSVSATPHEAGTVPH
jgi:cytoskeletal protein CcmA (bactofilin family)